jgi:fatty-acyl-CoA synthase
MLVTDFLWNNECGRGDKTALVCESRRQTYAQLGSRVRRLANALKGLGIRPKDHVAVLASNSAEHVEIVFAIAAVGAVWVPLNTRLSAGELTFIVEDSEAVALIYSIDLLATVERLDRKLGLLRHWIAVGTGSAVGESYESLITAASEAAPEIVV